MLEVVVPAHANPGSVDVVVTDEYSQASTLTKGYSYQLPSVTITSVTPKYSTMEGGTTITITGTGFMTKTTGSWYKVYLGQIDGTEGQGATYPTGQAEATNVTVVNSTTMTATLPAHSLGKVDITVGGDYSVPVSLPSAITYLPDQYKFLLDSSHPCSTDTINTDGTSCTVMATQPATFTIQAEDKNGAPVTSTDDITLNMATTSTSGSFARALSGVNSGWDYSSIVIPAGKSNITFYYRDAIEGTPTLTAKDVLNTSASDTHIKITSRYRILVTGVTNPTNVGVPSSVTVQAVDYQGIAQSDYNGTISFTSTDLAATIPGSYTFTPTDHGRHTFTNAVTFATQGTWNVTATDTASSEITGTQYDIVVGAPASGTIAQLKFITSPQSFPLDQTSSTITAQVQDADGVPVPVSADTTIYLKSDSSTGSYSTDNGTTWQDLSTATNNAIPIVMKAGTTSVNFLYKDTTKGTHTMKVSATATGDYGWTYDTQKVVIGVGAPYQIILNPSSNNIPVGQWTPVDVVVEDKSGNIVTTTNDITSMLDAHDGVSYSFSADGSNPTETINPTILTGNQSATIYLYSTKTGNVTFTASDTRSGTDLLQSGTATINFISKADRLLINSVPSSVSVDDSTSITVSAVDQFGNVIPVVGDALANLASYYTAPNTTSAVDGGCKFAFSAGGTYSSNVTTKILNGNSTSSIIYMQCHTVHDNDTFHNNDTPVTIEASDGGNTPSLIKNDQSFYVLPGTYAGKLAIIPTDQVDSSNVLNMTAGVKETFKIMPLDQFGNATSNHQDINIGVGGNNQKLDKNNNPRATWSNGTDTKAAFNVQGASSSSANAGGLFKTLTSSDNNGYYTTLDYLDTLSGTPTIQAWDQGRWITTCYGTGNDQHCVESNSSITTNSSQGKSEQSNNFSITINPNIPDHYEFTTDSHVTVKNTASGAIAVNLLDAYDNLSYYKNDTTNQLTSSSSTGTFYSDVAGTTNVTGLLFKANVSSATFYYKDSTMSTASDIYDSTPYEYTLSIGGGLTNNTQGIRIIDGLPTKVKIIADNGQGCDNGNGVIAPYPAGSSIKLTICAMTTDTDGTDHNAVVLDDTNVSITDSLPTGTKFYSDAGLTNEITSGYVTISKNTALTTIYYVPTKIIHHKVTASATFNTTYSYNRNNTNDSNNKTNNSIVLAGTTSSSSTDTLSIDISPLSAYQLSFTAGPGLNNVSSNVEVSTPSSSMTVDTEDIYGNDSIYSNTADTTINLSSSSPSGQFATNTTVNNWGTTTATIPAGQFMVSGIYYRDGTITSDGKLADNSVLGSQTITASLAGLNNGTLALNLVGNIISSMSITPDNADIDATTKKFSLVAGQTSGLIKLQLLKSDGTAAIMDSDHTINLSSINLGDNNSFLATYGTDVFMDENGQVLTSNQLTVAKGSSYVFFKVEPKTAVNHRIIAITNSYNHDGSYLGQVSKAIELDVTPGAPAKLRIDSPQQIIHPDYTYNLSEISDPISIVITDQFGNKTVATSDTTVDLSVTGSDCSSTGHFYNSTVASSTPVTTAFIAKGSNTTSGNVYYEDTEAHADPCTMHFSDDSNVLTAISQDITVRERVYAISITGTDTTLEAGQTSSSLTIHTLDRFGNPVTVEKTAMTINISSDDTSSYLSPSSLTIPVGQETSAFTYKHTTALDQSTNYVITASDAAGHAQPGTYNITVVPGAPAALSFSITGISSEVGKYTPMNVKVFNKYGLITFATSDITANLATNAAHNSVLNTAGGKFFTKDTNGNYNEITSATIASGTKQTDTIYYQQTLTTNYRYSCGYGWFNYISVCTSDSPTTLTTSATSLSSAAINASISPVTLSFSVGSSFSMIARSFNWSAMTLNADEALPTDTVIDLSTTAATGKYYDSNAVDSNGNPTGNQITKITLPAGQTKTATFYYWQTAKNNDNYYYGVIPDRLTAHPEAPAYSMFDSYTYATVGFHTPSKIIFLPSSPSTLEQNQTGTYTIETLDDFGNISPLVHNADIYGHSCLYAKLSTTSTDATIVGSASDYCKDPGNGVVALTFSAGQTSASFTYKDMKLGTNTLIVSNASSGNGALKGTMDVTITPATTKKVIFDPSSYALIRGDNVVTTLRLMSNYGIETNSIGDVNLTLTSSSASGMFKDVTGNWVNSLVVTIPSGSTTINVTYKDDTAPLGSSTITATDNANYLTSGKAKVSLVTGSVAGFKLSPDSLNLERGQTGSGTVVLLDSYGNETATTTGTCVYLTSSADQTKTTITTSGNGTTCADITRTDNTVAHAVYIAAGESEGNYTIRSTDAAGSYTITASSLPIISDLAMTVNQPLILTDGEPVSMAFDASEYTMERGEIKDMAVTLLNAYGVEVPATKNIYVNLTSTTSTARFALSASDTPSATKLGEIAAGQSRLSLLYSDTDPQIGDSTLTAHETDSTGNDLTTPDYSDATAIVHMVKGDVAQLVFTTPERTTIATHPSLVMTVEEENKYGYPTWSDSDLTIYPRTDDDSGEFSTSSDGPWTATNLTIPAQQSSIDFYYRDETVGTHKITVKDNLSPSDGETVLEADQDHIITKQVFDHYNGLRKLDTNMASR